MARQDPARRKRTGPAQSKSVLRSAALGKDSMDDQGATQTEPSNTECKMVIPETSPDQGVALATLYGDILRAIPDRVTVCDLNGSLVFSNWKEAALLRPQRPNDQRPQCWACFFHGDRDCLHCQADEVLRTGKLQAKEVYNPMQRRFWAVSHFPVRNAAGAITMVAEMVKDVTQARRTEQALRVAKNAAEAADRAKR